MADVRGSREHLFSSERRRKTARNLKGDERGAHHGGADTVGGEKTTATVIYDFFSQQLFHRTPSGFFLSLLTIRL